MVHVADVQAGLAWYQRAFPLATCVREEEFELLLVDGVQLEVVLSDEKVGSGSAGSVIYWRAGDLNTALSHMRAIGAQLYRGPMKIEQGLGMCQVKDPWGNCIGLRGPVQ